MADSIGKVIYSVLSGDATLTGLVSGNNIYPVTPPQNTGFPFIVYTTTNTQVTDEKDGTSPIDIRTVQVDMYAKSYDAVQTIKDRVRTLLDGYSGTVSATVVQGCRMESEDDGAYIEEVNVYAVSQAYRIRIART